MRRHIRLFWVLLATAASMWLSLPYLSAHIRNWYRYLQVTDTQTLSATVKNSLAYTANSKEWLTFTVPDGTSQIRIISNAHILRQQTLSLNPDWAYALRYQLLNNNKETITQGVYYQHSGLTAFKNQPGKLVYNNFYANQDLIPLDGRLILLGLQAEAGAAFLRLRLEPMDTNISEAAIRVYVPTKLSGQQLATSWLRMDQEQKDRLAESNIYPAALLTGEEKANLLQHQWQPIGPEGIDGKDYQVLTLYSLDDTEMEPFEDGPMLAAGLQADAQHYGVIPLPEGGGQLSLSIKAPDGSALANPVPLNLQWFGRGKDQRWQQNTVWQPGSSSLDYPIDGGLLVIRPASPIVIGAYLTTATETKRDITEATTAIKTYRASFNVDYNIIHFQQQPSVLRVDVRRLLFEGQTPQPENIRYQWLDAQQQTIASGTLAALTEPSLYDRIDNNAENKIFVANQDTTDPVSYYFNLPAEVTRFRLQADSPDLLVNAYNQPYGFTKWQRVPEDAYIKLDKEEQNLSWFPLRAQNDGELAKQMAIQWVSGQYRPPEDDPEVLAGRYFWQDFLPQGQNAGHYLLTEYTGEEPRADALSNVYCPLPTNQDISVSLAAFNGLRSVSPELVYLRGTNKPFSAELLLGQEKVLAIKGMGQQGLVRLPETLLGNRQLRLDTDSGGRWLMNYQAQCHGQRYLKRQVFALGQNTGLDFTVTHGGIDEVLSARWYVPVNTVDRSQVTVTIEAITSSGPGPAIPTSWTNRKHLYDIRPLSGKAMPVLYSQGQVLAGGELFAIPLNSDLPPGEYRIHMGLAKGQAGYVSLSQILPGIHDQRRFFQENNVEMH